MKFESKDLHDLHSAINRMTATIKEAVDAVCEFLKTFNDNVCSLKKSVYAECPNKKVVHLAIYGKNKRVRAKNFKRAVKLIDEKRSGRIM